MDMPPETLVSGGAAETGAWHPVTCFPSIRTKLVNKSCTFRSNPINVQLVRRSAIPSRLSMAVHRNKVLDGAISNGHHHRKVVICVPGGPLCSPTTISHRRRRPGAWKRTPDDLRCQMHWKR